MAQILVRNLDKRTVSALKGRAKQHRRSLAQEVKLILEEASVGIASDPAAVAEGIRNNLRKRGLVFSDSGESQAEDRAR
jgi:plasmid stability protein